MRHETQPTRYPPIASWFMNEADVLLVFGASFSKVLLKRSSDVAHAEWSHISSGVTPMRNTS
ncbi:MAG: hypothetical protein F6J93_15930 [Oscillatoria sp. SIO1A7]|nr:hypothetical protein [Oscillatoria sp. SIO1A7]